jgi:putative restriction endonuclease
MRLYVAVTDSAWFQFHAQRKPYEVNFWRPGGKSGFVALKEGDPFLFKLHAPDNLIAGGGFFVKYSKLPLSMAWRVFGEENGSANYNVFRHLILNYRREPHTPAFDPIIGCTVLAMPFFLPRELWISAPEDWHPNIVQGKTYDAENGIGKKTWDRVMSVFGQLPGNLHIESQIREKGPLYVIEGRVGQGFFRTNVLDAYHRRCAITQERTLPALEASHIKPYNLSGPNEVNNGLLFRADLHQIFDEGYLTITKEYRIQVSKRIKQEYENGREYYRFDGQLLPNIPDNPAERPLTTFIEWHNENVYRG